MSSSPTSFTSVQPHKIASKDPLKSRRKSFRASSIKSFLSSKSRRDRLSPSPKNSHDFSLPKKKHDRRDMVRTVSRDDELLCRGANPRTGVISPRETRSLENGLDCVPSRPQQDPLQSRGKWQQDKSAWVFVDVNSDSGEPLPPVEMETTDLRSQSRRSGDTELFRRYQAELQRGIQSCEPNYGLVDPFDPPTPRESSPAGPSSPRTSFFDIKRKPVSEPTRREGSTGTVIINGTKRDATMPAAGRLIREGHVNFVTPKHSPPQSLPPSTPGSRNPSPFLGQRRGAGKDQNHRVLQVEDQKVIAKSRLLNCEKGQNLYVVSSARRPWEPQNMSILRTPKQMSGNILRVTPTRPSQMYGQSNTLVPKQVRFDPRTSHQNEELYELAETHPDLSYDHKRGEAALETFQFQIASSPIRKDQEPGSSTVQDAPITITTTTTAPDRPRQADLQPRSHFRPEPTRQGETQSVPRVTQLRSAASHPLVLTSRLSPAYPLKPSTTHNPFQRPPCLPTLSQPTQIDPRHRSTHHSNLPKPIRPTLPSAHHSIPRKPVSPIPPMRPRAPLCPIPPKRQTLLPRPSNTGAGAAALSAMSTHRIASGGVRANTSRARKTRPSEEYVGWVETRHRRVPLSSGTSREPGMGVVQWCRGGSGLVDQKRGKRGGGGGVWGGVFGRDGNEEMRIWAVGDQERGRERGAVSTVGMEIPPRQKPKEKGMTTGRIGWKEWFQTRLTRTLNLASGTVAALRGDRSEAVARKRAAEEQWMLEQWMFEQWRSIVAMLRAMIFLALLYSTTLPNFGLGLVALLWISRCQIDMREWVRHFLGLRGAVFRRGWVHSLLSW
ncbi:hypothetical protein MMC10_002834 [Thelotrema lepadinum]|nr:hypothetical protein [Thelotrema lepadinum]